MLDRVWGWLHDDAHELGGLVALVDDRVVGFAHHRCTAAPARARPVSSSTTCSPTPRCAAVASGAP